MLHVLFIVRNYTSIILNFTQLDFVVFSKCMYIIWEILIMNKTTIKKKHKNRKNSLSYRKLRRWVLPAVLGAALSTLAIIPTLAAETQPNTNIAVVTTTEQTSIAHTRKHTSKRYTSWCATNRATSCRST